MLVRSGSARVRCLSLCHGSWLALREGCGAAFALLAMRAALRLTLATFFSGLGIWLLL